MSVGGDATGRPEFDFFISHAASDSAWADWLAAALEEAGWTTFVGSRDVVIGQNIIEITNTSLERSSRIVAVISPSYSSSPEVVREYQVAVRNDPVGIQRSLIPVRVADGPLPGPMANLVSIDLVGLDESSARERLIRQVGAAVRGRQDDQSSVGGFPGRSYRDERPSTSAESSAPSSTYPGSAKVRRPRSRRAPADQPGLSFGFIDAAPSSDTPTRIDGLGIGNDVGMLAALVAASGTVPPLSVALLGNWGSGKSSFMLQMARKIEDELVGRTGFVQSVRKVEFNAWHYSDEEVWSGLVERIFHCIADVPRGEPKDGGADQVAVSDRCETLVAELADLELRRSALQEHIDRVDAEEPDGLSHQASSPGRVAAILIASGRQLVRDVVSAWRSLLALAAVLALIAVVTILVIPAAEVALGSLLYGIAAAGWFVVAAVRSAWQAYGNVNEFAEQRLDESRARLGTTEESILKKEEELALLDTARRLEKFLLEKSDGAGYKTYRGIIGQVREDLERLHRLLGETQDAWLEKGGKPPLERIVLYIDDLDRCPPKTVARVLSAVHLMLSIPLFVVVVAIDVRWLLACLAQENQELFASGSHASKKEAETRALEYLDKIFQIPFALSAAGDRVDRYVMSLLPEIGLAHPVTDPAGTEADGGGDRFSSPDDIDAAEDALRVTSAKEDVETAPANLVITAREADFIRKLASEMPGPRAIKKLVNIYRMIRIGISATDLERFIGDAKSGGEFQVVVVLLVILSQRPDVAESIFLRIEEGSNESSILEVLERNPSVDADGSVTRFSWDFSRCLRELQPDGLLTDIDHFKTWRPHIARFSFHVFESTS